jgi:hypothetical protein
MNPDGALLRELAGERSQEQMGKLLSTAQTFVGMVYRGERRLGAASVRRLLTAFPDQRQYILDVLFPRGGAR